MTEKDLWQKVKRLLPFVHWQRIETVTSAGVPDVNGCYNGREAWIELKMLTGTRKLRFKHNLQPTQVAWLTRREHQGGRTFVMAMDQDQTIFVWSGKDARKLALEGPEVVSASLMMTKPYDANQMAERLF